MRYAVTSIVILMACCMVAPISAQLLRRRAYVESQVCVGGVCGPQVALQSPILAVQAPLAVETLTVAPRAPLVALVPAVRADPQAAPKKAEPAEARPALKLPVGDGPTVVYAPALEAGPVYYETSRRTPLRSVFRRLLRR